MACFGPPSVNMAPMSRFPRMAGQPSPLRNARPGTGPGRAHDTHPGSPEQRGTDSMKLRTSARLAAAALLLAALDSCGPATQLTSSWADPTAANHTYKKIAIVGVTPRTAARRMYEDDFSAELQARGITAVSSYTFAAGDGQLDQQAAAEKLKEIGADAVIVTRLVDKQTVETYYPPTYSAVAAPAPYYGGWYGYYSMGYTYMSTPGYVEQNDIFRLETNLYDLANDKLVWSGLTETTLYSGDAPEAEIHPLITALVYDMEKKKVLPKK